MPPSSQTLFALILMLSAIQASQAQPLKRTEYSAATQALTAQYLREKAACGDPAEETYTSCLALARSRQRLAQAELAQTLQPSAQHARALRAARANMTGAEALSPCAGLAVNPVTACGSDAAQAP